VGEHLFLELLFVPRRPATVNTGFEITVEIRVWVEFRGIRWQVEHFDLIVMFRQPGLEYPCMVNPQVVQDQVDLPLCALDQPLAEIHQQIRIHAALEDVEAHLALIVDCRDHVDGNPFGIEPYDRRLALGRVAPFMLAVVAYPGLIAPVDLCLLGLGLDLGVTLIQPLLDRLGIPLISPPDGLLGRKAPAFQVFTDRADRLVIPVSCWISSITALRVHKAWSSFS